MTVQLDSLASYTFEAINSNYMIGILVTSQAQGYIPSEGWSFGAGKTTFALSYAKTFCYGGNFNEVKKHTLSFAEELDPFLAPPKTPAVLIDDMQLDFGKHRSNDPDLKALCYFLTTQRPYISVIIGTASHRNMLAKDFREEIFHFEVIIPKRGTFEIQQLKRWIPFSDPLRSKERLEPFGTGPFLELLPEEQKWYDEWRFKRDQEAKTRLKLLQHRDQEEKVMSYRQFEHLYRDRLDLKGSTERIFTLWQIYTGKLDPFDMLGNVPEASTPRTVKEQLAWMKDNLELIVTNGKLDAIKVWMELEVARSRAYDLVKAYKIRHPEYQDELPGAEIVVDVKPGEVTEEAQFGVMRDLMTLKKSIAQTFQFQGLRVTESYDKGEPDLVVWKDKITPREVVGVRTAPRDLTINVRKECEKEAKFAASYGLTKIHLIVFDAHNTKVFDEMVELDGVIDLGQPTKKDLGVGGFQLDV